MVGDSAKFAYLNLSTRFLKFKYVININFKDVLRYAVGLAGQSFRRDSQKQYKSQQSSSSIGPFTAKDKKPSSKSNFRLGGGGQGCARRDRDTMKDLSSLAPSTKEAAGVGMGGRWWVGGWGWGLAQYQCHWVELFLQFPEMIRKISQGILIAFSDDAPTLLYPPSGVTHQRQAHRPSSSCEEALGLPKPSKKWRTPRHWVITVASFWLPSPTVHSDQSSMSRS